MAEISSSEKWYSRLARVANSTICFSLAYIVITYLFWFTMGLLGKLFGFDSFVYYYGIKYILNDQDWSPYSVTVLYSSGAFACLVFGLLCLFLYHKIKRFKTLWSLFLLWGFVIGTSIFSAQCLVASVGTGNYLSPYYQNLSVVYAWWHIPVPVVYMLAVPFLLLFAFFAVNFARPFALLAHSFSKVNTESRRKRYYLETVIVPFILGAGITSAVTFPMNIFVHAVYLMMISAGLLIGWISLTYIAIQRDDILKYESLQKVSPFFFFLLILLIFLVYTGWKGINLPVG